MSRNVGSASVSGVSTPVPGAVEVKWRPLDFDLRARIDSLFDSARDVEDGIESGFAAQLAVEVQRHGEAAVLEIDRRLHDP